MSGPMDQLQTLDQRLAAFQQQWQAEIERTREQERLRGLKYTRWVPPTTGQSAPTFGGATLLITAPVDQGFVWDLRIIAVKLSVIDSVVVYVGDNNNGLEIAKAPPPLAAPDQLVSVIYIPKSTGLLNGGENLFLQTSGAGNITSLRMAAWQAPAEQAGKLF
jgi:hypothetical protein